VKEGVTHVDQLSTREFLDLLNHLSEQEAREQEALDERVGRAIMLAPTLDICRALLRGENVPLSKLNPVYVRKYGIRRDAA
jgi:hypothetical protein